MTATLTTRFDRAIQRYSWNESDHPRGQPENAGQFAPAGSSSSGEKADPPRNPKLKPRSDEEIAAVQAVISKGKNWASSHVENAKHLTPEKRTKYEKSLHDTIGMMTAPMVERMMKTVDEISLYASTDDLTEELNPSIFGVSQGKLGGAFKWYSGDRVGTLHLDGGADMGDSGALDSRGIYAHEIGHAIDFAGTHSKTQEWQDAWKAEIVKDDAPLSKYATKTASEGFAEFFRLVNTQPKIARTEFPKCWAALKSWGYVS